MCSSGILLAGESHLFIDKIVAHTWSIDPILDHSNEVQIKITNDHYKETPVKLFVDKLDHGETATWLNELAQDDMKDLRDFIKALFIPIELKNINLILEELALLSQTLDEETASELYQWEGTRALVIDEKLLDDEMALSVARAGFQLIHIEDLKESLDLVQWAPITTEKKPQREIDILQIVEQIKHARKESEGDTDKAKEMANDLAERILDQLCDE